VPLCGHCYCGNKLNLTVYEASVKKYLEVTSRIGRDYGVSEYTQQRIRLIEKSITSIFGEQMDNSPPSLDSYDEGGGEQPLEFPDDPDEEPVVWDKGLPEKRRKQPMSLESFSEE
jgi:DNA polymerase II large subunit